MCFIIITDNIKPSSSRTSNDPNNLKFMEKSNPSVQKLSKTMNIIENNEVPLSPSEVKKTIQD